MVVAGISIGDAVDIAQPHLRGSIGSAENLGVHRRIERRRFILAAETQRRIVDLARGYTISSGHSASQPSAPGKPVTPVDGEVVVRPYDGKR